MNRSRRGFLLITTLLVSILIFLVCGAMVHRRSRQYEAANHQVAAARALALAEAGLEDARVKLNKDADFPPFGSEDQLVFSYVEQVFGLDGVTALGSYEVTLDMRWREPPMQIYRITSIGTSGEPDSPLAISRLTVELDVAPNLRSDFTQPNPNYFMFVSREGP
jgi:hypothetical protein